MFDFPRKNNLEWLRLIFATQVLLSHGSAHLNVKLPVCFSYISHFPGVPAFFFVSGFLIYASYLNSPGRGYFINRFLRLFPALLLVTIGGGAVVIYAHGIEDILRHPAIYAGWIASQLTLGQAYNPSYFRDVGVGVVNGSLWTITVEILFYLCVPLIVYLEKRNRYTLTALIAMSFIVYSIGPYIWTEPIYRNKSFFDILAYTPIIWGWMFGLGILAVKHFKRYRALIKFSPALIPIMLILIAYGRSDFFPKTGNHIGIFYYLCYVAMILWFAFGIRPIRLSFDLSYGVYVWHMPVINFLIVIAVMDLTLAVFLTFLIAALSWFFIERPALRLKKHSLKQV